MLSGVGGRFWSKKKRHAPGVDPQPFTLFIGPSHHRIALPPFVEKPHR